MNLSGCPLPLSHRSTKKKDKSKDYKSANNIIKALEKVKTKIQDHAPAEGPRRLSSDCYRSD